MRENFKIGFFDSGVGGISVMSYAREEIKNADYIYYADTDHVPYGKKNPEEVVRYSEAAVGCLVEHGADIVVVACNTATSMAIDTLRKTFSVPIIGMEPAVKPASVKHHGEKILVCATPLTIAGEKLHHLIDENYAGCAYPTLAALPELVTLAENAVFDMPTVTSYLKTVIDESENYAAVVLGCTHFAYFRDSFRALLGDIDMIDGTEGTVNRLKYMMEKEGISPDSNGEKGEVEYFISGRGVTDPKTLEYYSLLEKRAQYK